MSNTTEKIATIAGMALIILAAVVAGLLTQAPATIIDVDGQQGRHVEERICGEVWDEDGVTFECWFPTPQEDDGQTD